VDGRPEHFRLCGINNQNFLMMDDRTGSWWQQVSGMAVQGPLKGEKLDAVFYEELTFGTWKQENPDGRVLIPETETKNKNRYASADWEKEIAKLPVTSAFFKKGAIPGRTIVIGVLINGLAKAYPQSIFSPLAPLNDVIGKTPIVLLVDRDGRSIRCFISRAGDTRLELFAKPGTMPHWFDSETGSEWDFSGEAISGKWKGTKLEKVPVLKDYWFDWKTHHPQTSIYSPK